MLATTPTTTTTPKASTKETSNEEESKHLSEEEHRKVLKRRYKEDIEDFQAMREEERMEGMTPQRARFFNNEIERLQQKLKELEEQEGEKQ